MTKFGLIYAGIRHRPLRTALTVMLFALALTMLTMTVSVVHNVNSAVNTIEPARIHIIPLLHEPLPLAYVDQLSRVPDASDPQWLRTVHGMDQRTHYEFNIVAISDRWLETFPRAILDPGPELVARWRADRQGLLATDDLAAAMHWKEGSLVTLDTTVGPLQARVVGVFKHLTEEGTAIIHYDHLNNSVPTKDVVFSISVAYPADRLVEGMQVVEKNFELSAVPVFAMDGKTTARYIMESRATIPRLMTWVGVLVVLLTAVFMASSLSMSLRERSRAFAVLRAIGFSRGKVLRLIVGESVLLSATGAMIGTALPYLLFHEHGLTIGGATLQNVTVNATTCLEAFVGATVLAAVVALGPGVLSFRRDIVRTLQDN